jgi:hypothetical protein
VLAFVLPIPFILSTRSGPRSRGCRTTSASDAYNSMHLATIEALAGGRARDEVTHGHIRRVQRMRCGSPGAERRTNSNCGRSKPRHCCTITANWRFPSTSSTSRTS